LILLNTNEMSRFFSKMAAEFFADVQLWQWWVCQAFATVSIIFCVTAMQQRKTTNILWHRSIYSLLLFGGVCFIGKLPAMIMIGMGFVRNLVLLVLSYKTEISKAIKWSVFGVLVATLVALNIIFWEGYLSILSIIVGLAFLIAFIQSKPANVRRVSIAAAGIAIIFYILSFLPVNAFINLAVLISSIVGLIRLDRRKKSAA